jgi:hypothetical protein
MRQAKLAAALFLSGVAAQVASGQSPASATIPYDGEWTLTYQWSTPPGGFVAGIAIFKTSFHASKRVTVQENGSFSWELSPDDGDRAHYLHDESGSLGGVKKVDRESLSGFMRGHGSVDAEHALELHLEWGVLEGTRETLTLTHLEFQRQTVSADNTQFTRSFKSYCFTCVRPRWEHYRASGPVQPTGILDWRLVPVSRVVERLGPEMERETVIYRASRQATNIHSERIEVVHVRYGEIVLRAAD